MKATLNDPNVSIETIFAGSMPYFSIMGIVLIALVFVTINLIVDLLYFAVDPRLRVERSGSAH